MKDAEIGDHLVVGRLNKCNSTQVNWTKLLNKNSVEQKTMKQKVNWTIGQLNKNLISQLPIERESLAPFIINSTDLIQLKLVTHADVKKMYRKACLAVHPDKQMGSDNENISKMIFTELNDAWAKFQEEESP